MTLQENGALLDISEKLGVLKTKIDAVMTEQASAANLRGEIFAEQHQLSQDIADLKRDVGNVKQDVAEMKPAIAKGKRMLLLFIGLVFGAGFSASEIRAAVFRFFTVIP